MSFPRASRVHTSRLLEHPHSLASTPGATPPTGPATHTDARVARPPKRYDIQGLRAICMIQVLLFHAWNAGSPIGLDAFLMISAFLMTASFIRNAERGRTPFFVERWANTFKRLLPPLIVVVFVSLWASVRLLPANRLPEIFDQAFASLTYTQNWRLINVAADYFAENSAMSSPFMHLWSMSVQGQVFLLWPVILALCVFIAKRFRWHIRPVAFVVFTLIGLASLVWLIWFAPTDGSVYFYTRARLWEFALGSLFAIAAPWLTQLRFPHRVISWLSLAVMALYYIVVRTDTVSPIAAISLIAVSMLLIFPSGDDPRGASRLLAWKPLVNLGDISYAVYLVHWPIFVIYLNLVGDNRLAISDGIMLIMLSILVAWGLTLVVDNPIHAWPWSNRNTRNKVIVAVVALAVGIGGVFAANVRMYGFSLKKADPTAVVDLDTRTHPGALALHSQVEVPFTETPLPDPTAGWKASLPDPCDDGAPAAFSIESLGYCSQVGDPATATRRILAVGSSKLTQWSPALVRLAKENNWYIQLSHHSACPWSFDPEAPAPCQTRNSAALDYVDTFQPDYVLLLSTQTAGASPDERLIPGLPELIAEINARGVPVIGLRDTLGDENNLLECSLANPTTGFLGGCILSRPSHQAAANPADEFSADRFASLDLTDQLCAGDICPTTIGNIYVYADTMHVTNEYMTTMAPVLNQRMTDAIAYLDEGW